MDKAPAKQLQLPKAGRFGQLHRSAPPMTEAERISLKAVMSATPEEVVASKEALKDALQSKFIKHHIGMPSETELIDGNNYVVGQDGLYLVRKNKIGTFITKANKIPFIDDSKQPVEGFHMSLERKVPYQYLLQTISFFKKVLVDKGNAEAMVQIAWKEGEGEEPGEYIIHVADQEVSGAMVKFKRDETFERSHTLLLDIHSHNTMGAFFSGTDNADEKEARAYGVIGQLNKDWPAMKWRAGDGNGGWIELSMYEVFETPEANTEFPGEWMERVHKPGSGVFTEHNRPVRPTTYYPGYKQPMGHMPNRPWNPNYDRQTFDPEYGWGNRRASFGRAGSVDQDILGFDWDRWEEEVGPFEGEEEYTVPQNIGGDVGVGINALVESLEILNEEDATGVAIALIDKLDSRGKDIFYRVLVEGK